MKAEPKHMLHGYKFYLSPDEDQNILYPSETLACTKLCTLNRNLPQKGSLAITYARYEIVPDSYASNGTRARKHKKNKTEPKSTNTFALNTCVYWCTYLKKATSYNVMMHIAKTVAKVTAKLRVYLLYYTCGSNTQNRL